MIASVMAKRTRSKSFFVDRDLMQDASFENFEVEVQKKYEKMEKKRKFCGTKPLKRLVEKFKIDRVELKDVSGFYSVVFEIGFHYSLNLHVLM